MSRVERGAWRGLGRGYRGSGAGRETNLPSPPVCGSKGVDHFTTYIELGDRRISTKSMSMVRSRVPDESTIVVRVRGRAASGAACPHSSVYLGLLRLSAYTVVRVATSARSAELLIRADHAPSGARAPRPPAEPELQFRRCCRDAGWTWSREARARPAGKGAGLAYGDNIYDRVKTHLPRGGRSLPFCRGLPCTARAASPWHRPSGRSGATSTSTLHYYVNYEVQFDGFAIRARVIRGPTLRGL